MQRSSERQAASNPWSAAFPRRLACRNHPPQTRSAPPRQSDPSPPGARAASLHSTLPDLLAARPKLRYPATTIHHRMGEP